MIKKNINTPRHVARIAAVQALYQLEQTQENVQAIIRHMIEADFNSLKEQGYTDPEMELFKELVEKTPFLLAEIDPLIEKFLQDAWRLDRLSYTLRAILRLATFELKYFPTISEKIILNEYIEMTKEFSENRSEVSFVNGIIDSIAKYLRAT